MSKQSSPGVKNKIEEKPPLFRNWKTWYFVVLGNLAFLILLFHLFTRYYS